MLSQLRLFAASFEQLFRVTDLMFCYFSGIQSCDYLQSANVFLCLRMSYSCIALWKCVHAWNGIQTIWSSIHCTWFNNFCQGSYNRWVKIRSVVVIAEHFKAVMLNGCFHYFAAFVSMEIMFYWCSQHFLKSIQLRLKILSCVLTNLIRCF